MSSPARILRDRYRLERVLGRGGSGTVFLGRDLSTDRLLAVKEICLEASSPRRRQSLLEQFELEAQLLCSLVHPGLPQVYDSFEEGEFCYLVMDYIEGTTLRAAVREHGPPSVDKVLEWAQQICEILAYLHTQSPPVILRDLKPSNLMLTDAGRIQLIDFGIAKLHDPGEGMETRTSARGMLTPGYASPEQYSGGTDQGSDLYALGATLYYLLTGQVPPESIYLLTGEERLVPLEELCPNASQSLAALVDRLLSLKREERPSNAEAVRQLLAGILNREEPTIPAPLKARPSPASKPRRWKWAWLAALVLLLGGAAMYLNTGFGRDKLRIGSLPPDAEVFVNEEARGRTPLEVALPRGRAQVRISTPGRIPVAESVLLDGGGLHMLLMQLPIAGPPRPPDTAYPASQGEPISQGPSKQDRRELLGLGYSAPEGWSVVEEQVGQDTGSVLLEAPGRRLELSVGPCELWPSQVQKEALQLQQDGWQLVSRVSGERRAILRIERFQGEWERSFRLYLREPEDRIARAVLTCAPAPKHATLVEEVDLLRGHLDRPF